VQAHTPDIFDSPIMPTLLAIILGAAAYAGYKGWPLFTVIFVGGAMVIWNLIYFGARPMQAASGGPLAYLFRISIINILQAAAAYAAGFGLYRLIG
jgi:hypothetical protein